MHPLRKQFQVVLSEAAASWVLIASSEAAMTKLTLLVKKEKKERQPLSSFHHDGVRDAIAEALFLI